MAGEDRSMAKDPRADVQGCNRGSKGPGLSVRHRRMRPRLHETTPRSVVGKELVVGLDRGGSFECAPVHVARGQRSAPCGTALAKFGRAARRAWRWVGTSRKYIRLGLLHAPQFPLRNGHLLHIELFGASEGLPFGFQIVTKLQEFLGVFGRQHDGARAESVTEGVEPDCRFSLRGSGAGRLLRVAPISLYLSLGCHLSFLNEQSRFFGRGCHTDSTRI